MKPDFFASQNECGVCFSIMWLMTDWLTDRTMGSRQLTKSTKFCVIR